MLDGAQKVIIVPGYGMAVSQCQHQVKEFADLIAEKYDTDVKYAIHPVAGRMPGHMNVLLAEANVPYEQLIEMDEINPEFPDCDVALVIGANDTTNPAARSGERCSLLECLSSMQMLHELLLLSSVPFRLATQVLTTISSTWTRQ